MRAETATLRIAAVKNLLVVQAALFVLASAVPCSALETPFELRGAGKDAPVASKNEGNGTAPSTSAASVRKVRIVLGSPYGN